jgi:hypothetical protein
MQRDRAASFIEGSFSKSWRCVCKVGAKIVACADSDADPELAADYLCNPASFAHFVGKSRPAMELWP